MLRHKALIQGARYAFGFAGIYDEDEGERIKDGEEIDVAERIEAGTQQQAEDLQKKLDKDKIQDAEHSDVETEDPNKDKSETETVQPTDKKPEKRIKSGKVVEQKTDTGIDDQIAAICADIEKIGLFYIPLIRDVTGSDKYDTKISAKKKQDLLTKLKRYYADNMQRMNRTEENQDIPFPGNK